MCVVHLGKDAPLFKNHKNCPYKAIEHVSGCEKCQKVQNRRDGVATEKKICYVPKKNRAKAEIQGLNPGEKACRKCQNHGIVISIKNRHKLNCQFSKCDCVKCSPTNERRKHGTEFTKLHRELSGRVKTKTRTIESPDSGIALSPGTSRDSFDSVTNNDYEFKPVEVLICTEEEALRDFGEEAVGAYVEILDDSGIDNGFETSNEEICMDLEEDTDENCNVANFISFNDSKLQKEWYAIAVDGNVEDTILKMASAITSDDLEDFDNYFVN